MSSLSARASVATSGHRPRALALGETLFIEPRELVESNNQLRIAQVDVAAEERASSQRLTRLVARFADELELNEDILTYLDLAHASARLARDLDMKPVTLTAPDDNHAIDVREAGTRCSPSASWRASWRSSPTTSGSTVRRTSSSSRARTRAARRSR